MAPSQKPSTHQGGLPSKNDARTDIDASPRSHHAHLLAMCSSRRNDARNRRERRRAEILGKHKDNLARILRDCDTQFEELRKQMLKTHHSQLQVLLDLIKRRSRMEEKMLQRMKRVEDALLRAKLALKSVLDARRSRVKALG